MSKDFLHYFTFIIIKNIKIYLSFLPNTKKLPSTRCIKTAKASCRETTFRKHIALLNKFYCNWLQLLKSFRLFLLYHNFIRTWKYISKMLTQCSKWLRFCFFFVIISCIRVVCLGTSEFFSIGCALIRLLVENWFEIKSFWMLQKFTAAPFEIIVRKCITGCG